MVSHVATHGDCQWIVTAEILKEYLEVLQRPKFALPAELIEMRTLLVASPTADAPQLRDPKDAIFLAAAVSAGADFLITGDNDLLQAKSSVTTRIVTVSEFAAEFAIG